MISLKKSGQRHIKIVVKNPYEGAIAFANGRIVTRYNVKILWRPAPKVDVQRIVLA